AVKRRFVFSKEFKQWNVESRTKLWESLVSNSSISGDFSNTQVQNFAERYQVNAGNITSSIETVSKLYQGGSIKTEEIESVLDKILQENNLLVGGGKSSGEHLKTTPYDASIINSDQDIIPIKDTLKDFIKTPENKRSTGINILFWGAPGTGKTAAARYIGNNLGVVLNEKKASDLMGSLLGETEKNIEEYFRGMTGDNQVALLDEADSFFINRATVRNTWERLQTNELLTQMENHSGVLFCCTNDLKSLDPAVLRRFTWKVEFSSMDKPGVKKLFKKYFPLTEDESSRWETRLDNMSGITPGDFSILWKRYSLTGKSIPCTDIVLDDLEKELAYRQEKKAAIGF
ncbi:MAG: ATP-binding protein, partial [Spirochaetota bacterium]|nr:ATP-binding protein [Spirochaetota bacterium]